MQPEGVTVVLEPQKFDGEQIYRETALPFAGENPNPAMPKVPGRIREMMKLYEHGDGSYLRKCRNFLRQGMFMEDYEDDRPWTGDVRRYFPTYHDFDVQQLRGYFTWRTGVRKGEYGPIAASLAYLYLYELLASWAAGGDGSQLRGACHAGKRRSADNPPDIGKRGG